MKMRLLFLLFFAATLQGQTVSVVATSPTQAVLRISNGAACSIEVSESPTYSPVVPDVDGTLFGGAGSDATRNTSLIGDNDKIVVIGKRRIDTTQIGTKVSRSLQQGTTHYYRICGTASGTFTTKTYPFGVTYTDLPQYDFSNGSYVYPTWSTSDRTQKIVDYQTGSEIKHVWMPSDDTNTNGVPQPNFSGFGELCSPVVSAQGNYHCITGSLDQGIFPFLYGINPTTGAVVFLGSAWYPNWPFGGASVSGALRGDMAFWDASDANVLYVAGFAGSRSFFIKYTYTGADNPANNIPASGGTPAQTPYTAVDLLGGGDIATMAHAFKSEFDPSLFPCTMDGYQGGYFLFSCRRGNQDSYGWTGVYNPGNGLPLGSGGNGRIIALTKMWANTGSRWCGIHTYEYMGQTPISSYAVSNLYSNNNGIGPYNAVLGTTMSDVSSGTTSITLSSAWDGSWGTTPGSFASGEPVSTFLDHWLQTSQVGDIVKIDNEHMLITAKPDSAHITVQRNQGGFGHAAHSIGANVTMMCTSAGNPLLSSGGYLWWDFVNYPAADSRYQIQFGSHPVSRGNYRVDSNYTFRTGAATNYSTWGLATDGTAQADMTFASYIGPGGGNFYQKHISMAASSQAGFYDSTYWVGGNLFTAQDGSAVSNVTGTLYKYLYNGVAYINTGQVIETKRLPILARTYGRMFQDVSGPGVTIGGGSGDNYKFCIANAANECHTGSAKGDVYFNHPNLKYYYCTGGENPVDGNDICIGPNSPFGVAAMQFKLVNDSIGSTSPRVLSRTWSNYEIMASSIKPLPDESWALQYIPTTYTTPAAVDLVAVKIPAAVASDGVNRSTFIPATISIITPQGLGITGARVKFGYLELGQPSDFYCTSRREICVATTSTITESNPFSYVVTDNPTPMPCAAACTVVIPALPLHTAYYQVEYLGGGGGLVSIGESGVIVENIVAPMASSNSGVCMNTPANPTYSGDTRPAGIETLLTGSAGAVIQFSLRGGGIGSCTVELYTDAAMTILHSDTQTASAKACSRAGNIYGEEAVTAVLGAISPLSPSTNYYYRITDGSRGIKGSFYTSAVATTASVFSIQAADQSAVTLALEYSASSDLDSPNTVSVVFQSQLATASFSVPHGEVLYYRWKKLAAGGVVLAAGPIAVAVAP